jgi:hypothetical protein
MADRPGRVGPTLSALYATILTLGVALLTANKLTIWAQLGSSEKFWTLFALAYSFALMASGWVYVVLKTFVFGLGHSVLMLAMFGLVLFTFLSGKVTGPGSDNAAAGVLAWANLVFLLAGSMAAICGVSVLRRVWAQKHFTGEF